MSGETPGPPRRRRRTGTTLARPARIRLSFTEDSEGSIRLPLPARPRWPVAIVTGILFVTFAWIAVGRLTAMGGQNVEGVFGLTVLLFQGFWVLGWSVGVLVLFLLTVALLFYRESAHITAARLVHVQQLGPLRISLEYDLAKISNLRLEETDPDHARIRFAYANGDAGMGNDVPRSTAQRHVDAIRAAIAARAGDGETPVTEEADRPRPVVAPKTAPSQPQRSVKVPPASAPSSLALLGANLIPLLGVLLLDWDLGQVMVLFWAENAVVGFYNLLKLAVVAKWAALFVGTFFVGHYGGFMAGHFLFIYYLFVRGMAETGPEAPLGTALGEVFGPLWPALLALFLSHGISFYTNFLRGREYVGRTTKQQMAEPYKRIVVLHVTIIFGGWAIMLLGTPVAALVLLIVLKAAVDLRAHRKEHAATAA